VLYYRRRLIKTPGLSLRKSGDYSDSKIVCGPDVYYVHKAIICPQSDFFRAACSPDTFQEGLSGIVRLPFNPGRDMATLKAPIKADEFDWDLDVEDTTAIKFMIHYFYHHDYPSGLPRHPNHNEITAENAAKGVLATHSQMYAMGDKYQIPGLKTLAVRKFRSFWRETCAGFATAIVIAFMSTPEADQRLRNAIVYIIGECGVTASEEVVDDTVKDIPELLYALYRKLLEER
jgi:hypothetical protein